MHNQIPLKQNIQILEQQLIKVEKDSKDPSLLFEALKLASNSNLLSVASTIAIKLYRVIPSVDTAYCLAVTMLNVREYESAIKVCRENLPNSISAKHAELQNLMGLCFKNLGLFDEAKDCFESVLKIKPNHTNALHSLVKIQKKAVDLIGPCKNALEAGISLADQSRVHYSLAKIYNDTSQFEQAWREAKAANKIQQSLTVEFDPRSIRNIVDKTVKTHSCPSSINSNSKEHLLIVGMPRSGTTLLEQIITTSPEYYAGGETPALDFSANYSGMPFHVLSNCSEVSSEQASLFTLAYEKYFKQFGYNGLNRIVNKVPHNHLYIGSFKRFFPLGKIIYVTRDYRDIIASIFFEYFDNSLNYTTRIEDIIAVCSETERLMSHWQQIYSDDILKVNYESLVNPATQKEVLSLISSFLKIEKLEHDGHTRSSNSIETPSSWTARQPITTASVGRFKNYKALNHLPNKLT